MEAGGASEDPQRTAAPTPEAGSTEVGGEELIGATLEGLRRAAVEVEQIASAAETLQRALLPAELAEVAGLTVAGRYLAAGEEAQVGGDWYDVIALRDGKAGIVIGDVVGHGMHAASRMARLQSAVRAFALEGLRPGLALERTSWFAFEDERPTMATMLYAVIDPDEGTIRMASAAHPPPLVVTDGQGRLIEGPLGSPLGARQYPTYEETVVPLAPGATVVLYTDGLIEEPGISLDDGLQRLTDLAGSLPARPDYLADALLDEALGGKPPRDDVALLVARLDPAAPGPLELSVDADPRSLAHVRRALARWLRGSGVNSDAAYEVIVACGEACANAVAHAYPVGQASFELRATLDGDEVEVVVRDFGSWRDGDTPHSRGLRLMEQLVDDFEIDRGPGGTAVRLRRRVAN